MLTRKQLLEKGYREYPRTAFDNENIEHVYQKCFRDDKGIRYFMDVKKWKDVQHPSTGEIIVGGYEYETQLYKKDSHDAMNLLFLTTWDLDEAEAFVDKMFEADLLDYYEVEE